MMKCRLHIPHIYVSYCIQVGSALSKLAKLLKTTAKKLWDIQKIIRRVTKLTFGAFKTFTVGK